MGAQLNEIVARAIGTVLAGLITTFVIGLISSALRASKPKTIGKSSGTIVPDKISAWIVVVFGTALAVGGAIAAFSGQMIGAICLFVFGGGLALFMAPSLTSLHTVRWDKDSLVGPSTLFGPTLGLKRASLHWADINQTGKTVTGYWYVETESGQRIYWSYLYKGYGALTDALRYNCPKLILPDDMA